VSICQSYWTVRLKNVRTQIAGHPPSAGFCSNGCNAIVDTGEEHFIFSDLGSNLPEFAVLLCGLIVVFFFVLAGTYLVYGPQQMVNAMFGCEQSIIMRFC